MEKFGETNHCSHSEYELITNKILTKYYPEWLNNSEVRYACIKALQYSDQTFDGRGTLNGFRSNNAKNASLWKILKIKNSKFSDLKSVEKILTYNIKDPIEIFEQAKRFINDRDYMILEYRFRQNMTYKEIAKKIGITAARVEQKIRKIELFLSYKLKEEDYV